MKVKRGPHSWSVTRIGGANMLAQMRIIRPAIGPLTSWRSGRSKDQVEAIGGRLQPAERAEIDAEIDAEIAAAVEFAEKSPFPNPEEVLTDVYAS